MIETLIKSGVKKMSPYVCARHLAQTGVLLDANENAYGSVVKSEFARNLNRYPDPSSEALRTKLAEYVGVGKESICVGAGSDELIDLLIRIFVEADEEVVLLEPTYGMYRVAAEVNGVRAKMCRLTEKFEVDFAELQKTITQKTKMIFCASPNNPTGNRLKTTTILKMCKSFRGVVVLDEAYVEFSTRPSLTPLTKKFENLVILRTFSKAWGLAGVRLGYCIAAPEVLKYMNKIKLPYNVSRLASEIGIRALGAQKKLALVVQKTRKERNRVKQIGRAHV